MQTRICDCEKHIGYCNCDKEEVNNEDNELLNQTI